MVENLTVLSNFPSVYGLVEIECFPGQSRECYESGKYIQLYFVLSVPLSLKI